LSFLRPSLLWLLLLLPPIAAALVARYRRGIRAAGALSGGDPSALRRARLRGGVQGICFVAFFASAALCLAAPVSGAAARPLPTVGLNLVFAIDVSRSMAVRDCPGRLSRLEASVRAAESICLALPGARFAVRAFKGESQELVPLTDDEESLLSCLKALSPDLMSSRGSALSGALSSAMDSFDPGSAAARVLCLLTDGQEVGSQGQVAASPSLDPLVAPLRATGTSLWCLGSGGLGPQRVPDGSGGFVTGSDGTQAQSSQERGLLMDLAKAAGGEYVDTSDARALAALLKGARERAAGGKGLASVETPQTMEFPLLLVCAASLCVAGLSSLVRWRKK
jgi:Ca-activated chloride channel homolog